MSTDTIYTPPMVWRWEVENGGKFANINRPFAGKTHDKSLDSGQHSLQLYSWSTPNGVKVAILLEELLAIGVEGAEYDAYLIDIRDGDQFGSAFVSINPNSKIPALIDMSASPPVRVFESGSILLYLADKFDAFIPSTPAQRAECINWLFWQMGSAPYLGGGFGHFYHFAPSQMQYPIDRFTMEVKRQLDVLDRQLADKQYITGVDYTIADIAIWPWYAPLVLGTIYDDVREFLDTASYEHLNRWVNELNARETVQRGRMVNRNFGPLEMQLHERHDSNDFLTKTQDKLSQND